MSYTATHKTTCRAARFESLEERLALNASVPCFENVFENAPVVETFVSSVEPNAIDLSDLLDSEDEFAARMSQDVYYVREGSSVTIECVNAEEGLRYFWNFSGSEQDSPNDYFEGERSELFSSDLPEGRYPIRLKVVDAFGQTSAPTAAELRVQAAQSAFAVDVEPILNGLGVVLTIEARGADPISLWSIDWGDDSLTEIQELGDTISISHVFPESLEDAAYTISLIAVDAKERVSEDFYELATIEVPALDNPLQSYVRCSFYDAEKGSYTESRICWAAGTANVLYATGWADSTLTVDRGGTSVPFESEDDVYEYMVRNFDNVGSSALYGYNWFLTGDYPPIGIVGWAQPEPGSGGFYPALTNYNSLAKYYSYKGAYSDRAIFADVASRLEQGWGSTISLAFYATTPDSQVTLAHTITLWGFEYDLSVDPNSPDRYTAIYVSDSDDGRYQGRNAPNSLVKIHIEWSEQFNRYKLTDYESGECWLAEFIMLAPKSQGKFASNAASYATLDEAFATYSVDAAAILAELDDDRDDPF